MNVSVPWSFTFELRLVEAGLVNQAVSTNTKLRRHPMAFGGYWHHVFRSLARQVPQVFPGQ